MLFLQQPRGERQLWFCSCSLRTERHYFSVVPGYTISGASDSSSNQTHMMTDTISNIASVFLLNKITFFSFRSHSLHYVSFGPRVRVSPTFLKQDCEVLHNFFLLFASNKSRFPQIFSHSISFLVLSLSHYLSPKPCYVLHSRSNRFLLHLFGSQVMSLFCLFYSNRISLLQTLVSLCLPYLVHHVLLAPRLTFTALNLTHSSCITSF